MHRGVFRAHLTIIGRSVLEIITVTILHKFLPFGSHLSRRLNEVVFRPQVVAVVSLINLSNIIQKAFEGLSIAVLDCYCLTDDKFKEFRVGAAHTLVISIIFVASMKF